MSAFAFPSTRVLGFFVSQRKSSWWLLIVGFFYSPFLSVIECGQLSAPANGGISQPSSFGLNSVTSFTCDSGYMLRGSEQRRCQAAGTWDGSDTTCHRKAKRYLFCFFCHKMCDETSEWRLCIKMATDWQVSGVGDTCTVTLGRAGPRPISANRVNFCMNCAFRVSRAFQPPPPPCLRAIVFVNRRHCLSCRPSKRTYREMSKLFTWFGNVPASLNG